MAKNEEVDIRRVAEDFKYFVHLVWWHLAEIQKDPTPIQNQMCDWIQCGPRRQITEAFRGAAKSYITSCYVCWRLLLDPTLKFLIISAASGRAESFSTFTKALISEMPLLQHLKPSNKDARWSNIKFDVNGAGTAHQPSVSSLGIMSQLAGSRADVIIADDIEVLNNSATPDMRDKLKHIAITEFESILKPGGRIIFLGTPQNVHSIYNGLRDKNYVLRIWPVLIPTPEGMGSYKPNIDNSPTLAPGIRQAFDSGLSGHASDPKRFSDIEIQERRDRFGASGFALQFMLNTELSDALKYPLKLSDMMVLDCSGDKAPIGLSYSSQQDCQVKDIPLVGLGGDRWYRPFRIDDKWEEFEGSVMVIDPSGRGKDETAVVVVKMLHGFLYLTACAGYLGGYSESTLIGISKMAKEQNVNRVLIEENYGDGMFTSLLKPVISKYHPVTMEEVKHHTMKEARIIDTLEPVLNRHKLIVDRQVALKDINDALSKDSEASIQYSLFYQLTNISRDKGALKQDDKLDALAMAVSYWTRHMERDADEAIDQWQDRQVDAKLKRFMDNAMGVRGASGMNTHMIKKQSGNFRRRRR